MGHITLQDLADELNVSVSTVSKALKGYPDVSKKTRKAVIDLADKLNFSPNVIASNLRTRSTHTIGVIVPEIASPFFSTVINGILSKAEKSGYMVILLQSDKKYELEKKQIEHLIQQQVDGVLISLSVETPEFKHLERLKKRGIPLVMYDRVSTKIDCSKVIIDDKKAAFNAVSYLIRKGHKRIAVFRGPETSQTFSQRFNGYLEALEKFRIPFDDSLVYSCQILNEVQEGYKNAEKLIIDHGIIDVDAIFTSTDIIAFGVLKYLNTHNVKIPQDIAVFGFSDWEFSILLDPSLSTVHQPGYEMGEKSVDLLLQEMTQKRNKEKIKYQQIVLETSLEIRQST